MPIELRCDNFVYYDFKFNKGKVVCHLFWKEHERACKMLCPKWTEWALTWQMPSKQKQGCDGLEKQMEQVHVWVSVEVAPKRLPHLGNTSGVHFIFLYYSEQYFVCFLWDRGSLYSLAWPPTCHVAQGGLELDIPMPLPPKCGHYSVAYHVPGFVINILTNDFDRDKYRWSYLGYTQWRVV